MDISALLPFLLMNGFGGNGASGAGGNTGGVDFMSLLKLFSALNGKGSDLFGAQNGSRNGSDAFGNAFGNFFGKASTRPDRNHASGGRYSSGGGYTSDNSSREGKGSYDKNRSRDNLNAMFPEELLKMLRGIYRGR